MISYSAHAYSSIYYLISLCSVFPLAIRFFRIETYFVVWINKLLNNPARAAYPSTESNLVEAFMPQLTEGIN